MPEKIYIQIGEDVIEAKGKVLEKIIADRQTFEAEQERIEAEQQAKQATLDSAIAKLAKLGLTEDEAKAIIGIQ